MECMGGAQIVSSGLCLQYHRIACQCNEAVGGVMAHITPIHVKLTRQVGVGGQMHTAPTHRHIYTLSVVAMCNHILYVQGASGSCGHCSLGMMSVFIQSSCVHQHYVRLHVQLQLSIGDRCGHIQYRYYIVTTPPQGINTAKTSLIIHR